MDGVTDRCRRCPLRTNLDLVTERSPTEEHTMSNYYYGPALDTELDYRRANLRQEAADYRLARQARRAARTGGRHFGRRTAH
jgi:hypothetical protein